MCPAVFVEYWVRTHSCACRGRWRWPLENAEDSHTESHCVDILTGAIMQRNQLVLPAPNAKPDSWRAELEAAWLASAEPAHVIARPPWYRRWFN